MNDISVVFQELLYPVERCHNTATPGIESSISNREEYSVGTTDITPLCSKQL